MSDLVDCSLAWVKSEHYLEMTPRQFALLGLVTETDEGLHVRDLAVTMGVQKPIVTRAVNALRRFDLVKRHRGDDRRDCLIRATDAGRRFRELLRTVG
jgi:DNA-binding MarR family transcriptional regulator